MKKLTRKEIQELSRRELDDLLGYYDCSGQANPVYSESLDQIVELAEKKGLSIIIGRKHNDFFKFTIYPASEDGNETLAIHGEGKAKRTGAELILELIQESEEYK